MCTIIPINGCYTSVTKNAVLVAAGGLFSISCAAQIYSQSDFSQVAIPKVNSDAWYKLDTSNEIFSISTVDGHLQISKASYTPNKECKTSEGKILAVDEGEWGGGLYYKPDDVSKDLFFVNGKPVVADDNLERRLTVILNEPLRKLVKGKYVFVSPGNIPSIIPYQKGWLFVNSWTNMTGGHGSLCKLTIQNDSLIVTEICNIDDNLTVIALYKNKILLAANNSLYTIDDGKKELIFDGLFLERAIPRFYSCH